MKKRLFRLTFLLLLSLPLYNCSESPTLLVDDLTCKRIKEHYSKLILQEAISNGYVIGAPVNINLTEPLTPGYLDIYYDKNLNIYFRAVALYYDEYNLALAKANCR